MTTNTVQQNLDEAFVAAISAITVAPETIASIKDDDEGRKVGGGSDTGHRRPSR